MKILKILFTLNYPIKTYYNFYFENSFKKNINLSNSHLC